MDSSISVVMGIGTSIAVKGEAELRFQGPSGKQCSMKLLGADVKRPLASVSSIVDQGNIVVFGADASYVENIESGRRIPMIRRRGVFVLEIDAWGSWEGWSETKTHWNGSGRGREDWRSRRNRGREWNVV